MSSASDPFTVYLACQLSVAVYYEPGHQNYRDFEVFAFQGIGETKAVHKGAVPDGDSDRFHKCQWVAAFPKTGVGKDTLFIAFKGTSEAIDALLDLSFMDIKTKRGNRVHSGVYAGIQDEIGRIYEAVKNAKEWLKTKRVVFTGHSLGGAYGSLALLEYLSPPLPAAYDDISGPWPEDLGAEAITFGTPVFLRADPPSSVRMTHFVLNYDIVPRLFVLQNSTLAAIIEEAPKMAGGVIAQQIASIALKQSGLTSMKISATFDNLRKGYAPAGCFVFLQMSNNGSKLFGSASVIHPENGKSCNPTAKAALQYFPSIDPSCPCLRTLKDEKVQIISKSLEDHGVYRYLNSVRCLLSQPISFTKAVVTPRRRLPVIRNPPSSASLTPPPSIGAMRRVSTPWCLLSRNRKKTLHLSVFHKGVESWKTTVTPLSTIVLQGVKQPGDVLRIKDELDVMVAEAVIPPKNSTFGNSHLVLEHCGVSGYVLYESVLDEGKEIDIRCLYPQNVENWRLHVHKLAYYTSGMGEGHWDLTDNFGAGVVEEKWKEDDAAPTCRGCLVVAFSVKGVKRTYCHKCGLAHCPTCLPFVEHSLHAFINKASPICKKCNDHMASQLVLAQKASSEARSFLSLFCLARAKPDIVTPEMLNLILPFLVKSVVEQSVVKAKKKFRFDW
eukprot:TRINITY_DN33936_c0_g1_i1.p1 TRINITY_DN33936_c0_g1~~TRINITY_DN33936_c0_g1_i1.p1  ORF type:complete len:667 (+),score=47.03 TRINITY_DN33936_c0_g1_i1:49-2049(+)